jgi:hypothetical protein
MTRGFIVERTTRRLGESEPVLELFVVAAVSEDAAVEAVPRATHGAAAHVRLVRRLSDPEFAGTGMMEGDVRAWP